jgi:hypothetical protein
MLAHPSGVAPIAGDQTTGADHINSHADVSVVQQNQKAANCVLDSLVLHLMTHLTVACTDAWSWSLQRAGLGVRMYT